MSRVASWATSACAGSSWNEEDRRGAVGPRREQQRQAGNVEMMVRGPGAENVKFEVASSIRPS